MKCYPLLSKVSRLILAERYGSDWDNNQNVDSQATLSQRITNEAQRLEKSIISYIPDRFSWTDTFAVGSVPQYQFPQWKSLDQYLNVFAPTGGMLVLFPAVYQIFYSIQPTIRKHGLFSVGETIRNVPLCTAMIKDAGITTVVTYPEGAYTLAKALSERSLSDRLYLMVVIGDASGLLGTDLKQQLHKYLPNTNIIFDLQIFPGHTIAYQSLALTDTSNLFHLSEDYLWCQDDVSSYVTGLSDSVLPVLRHMVPVRFREIDGQQAALPTFEFMYG